MQPFLVVFDAWRGEGSSRAEQVGSQVHLAEANRRRLLGFIEKNGLKRQVASVAEGTVFGAVGVVMTPDAAKRIATLDGVTSVMQAG
jgi:hypothetical protein